MAARGTIAKNNVINKIKEIFGADYIGEYSNKIYVYSQENGEKIQIAISLTCPKTPVEVVNTPVVGDFNFEDDAPAVVAATGPQSAELTDEERERVKELMRTLGL